MVSCYLKASGSVSAQKHCRVGDMKQGGCINLISYILLRQERQQALCIVTCKHVIQLLLLFCQISQLKFLQLCITFTFASMLTLHKGDSILSLIVFVF